MNCRAIWLLTLSSMSFVVEAQIPRTTSGVPIPSGGRVSVISADDLPVQGRAMFNDSQKKSLSREGFVEHQEADDRFLEVSKKLLQVANPNLPTAKIAVKLIPVGRGFESFKFVGFIPEGTQPGGPWTWISRVFVGHDGAVLKLSEWDYVADGGGILQIKELLNQSVAGRQATLALSVSSSGGGLWTLAWVDSGKRITLELTVPTRSLDGRGRILQLAESLYQ